MIIKEMMRVSCTNDCQKNFPSILMIFWEGINNKRIKPNIVCYINQFLIETNQVFLRSDYRIQLHQDSLCCNEDRSYRAAFHSENNK